MAQCIPSLQAWIYVCLIIVSSSSLCFFFLHSWGQTMTMASKQQSLRQSIQWMFWNAHTPDNPSELPMTSIENTIHQPLQDEMPLVANTNTFPPIFSKLRAGLGWFLASGKRKNEELLFRPSTASKTYFQRKPANQWGKKRGYTKPVLQYCISPPKPIITHYHKDLRLQQLNHACNINQKLCWSQLSFSNKKPTHKSCFAYFKIQKQQYTQLNHNILWNNLWPSSTIMKIDNSTMHGMAVKNYTHWYHLKHSKLPRE